MKKIALQVSSLVIILTLALSSLLTLAEAQELGDSETVYVQVGKVSTFTFDLLPEGGKFYKHYIARLDGGRSMAGLEFQARARELSGAACYPNLQVQALYPEGNMPSGNGWSEFLDLNNSRDWSAWTGHVIPAGYDHGFASVGSSFPLAQCTGASLPARYELQIRVRDAKAPPTEPPVTEPPATEPPVIEPPATEPPVAPTTAQFWANNYDIEAGACTTLRWDVSGAAEVYWDGKSTYPLGYIDVCPTQTTTYVLGVLGKDGKRHDQQLTITVNQPLPPPPPPPPPPPTEKPDCDPTGKQGIILIVTDSQYLTNSTGDSNSWEKVRTALQQYYESGMVDCVGKPVFLDMAELYPQGGYTTPEIKQAISTELSRWKIDIGGGPPLGAIAIIGGSDVIPMPHLPDSTSLEGLIASDDVYADLYNDQFHTPDTVITRLPDGHSTDLMLNYIATLASGVEPPEGGVVLAPLQYSSHRLNFRPNYEEGYLYDDDDLLYLDDILKDKAGAVTYLISPVWSTWDKNPAFVDQKLIRLDDFVNSMVNDAADSSVGTMLTGRDVLIHSLDPGDDHTAVWFARNATQNSTHIAAYDFQEARSIPAGAHVFALLPHSADLGSGDQQAYYHIPLAMLNSGAHHYIGLTGKLLIAVKNPRPYNSDPDAFVDIDIAKYSGAFAQYYYRSRYDDPATSFWAAKGDYEREQGLSSPYDYKTYHSFIYYGLPEKGPYLGVYQSGKLAPLPQPSYNPLKGWSKCPSGDVNDCDGDGLPDKTEHDLVERFKPYLIAHPNDELIGSGIRENPFDVYWQVSPAVLKGAPGAFLTMVLAWSQDGGIDDIDIPWLSEDRLSCSIETVGISTIPELASKMDVKIGEGIVGHSGDTEALRMFLSYTEQEGWKIAYVDWKRHHETFAEESEGDPIPIDKAIDDGLEFISSGNGNHPIVYISQNKHAMYPSADACENYKWHLFGTCDPNIEDCGKRGKGLELGLPFTPPEYNVGEIGGEVQIWLLKDRIQLTYQLLDELPGYPREYAWRGNIIPGENGEFFCGGLDPSTAIMDEPCSGSMANMWFDPHNNPYEK